MVLSIGVGSISMVARASTVATLAGSKEIVVDMGSVLMADDSTRKEEVVSLDEPDRQRTSQDFQPS